MGDENQGKLVNGIQVGLYFFFIKTSYFKS